MVPAALDGSDLAASAREDHLIQRSHRGTWARGSRFAGPLPGFEAAGFLAVLISMWLAPNLRISKAYTAWEPGGT